MEFCDTCSSFTAPEMTRARSQNAEAHIMRSTAQNETGPVIPLVSIGRVRGRLRAIVACAHLCFVDSSAVNALRAMGAACLLAWSSTRAFLRSAWSRASHMVVAMDARALPPPVCTVRPSAMQGATLVKTRCGEFSGGLATTCRGLVRSSLQASVSVGVRIG